MAAHAQDVPLEALGRTFRFRIGFAAICEMEDRFEMPMAFLLARFFPELALGEVADPDQLLKAKASIRQSDVGVVLLAGLRHHHPDATAHLVAEMVDDIGLDEVDALFRQAALGAMQSGKAEGDGGGGDPRGARPNG